MDNTSQGEVKQGTFTNIRKWIGSHKLLTALVALVAIVGLPMLTPSQPAPQPQQAAQAPAMSVAEATNEFKDVMDTAEKATLVSSYEFSDTDRVIYVTDLWYTQSVSFKKDFLAKIAMLQEAINGKDFFEVRDYQSNEKVAEVTAFSGSLEVYK